MKRTDITELFPDATDEQIKKLMDLNGSDINAAKAAGDETRKQLEAANAALAAAKKTAETAISAEEHKKATDRAAALEKELADLKAANELRDLRYKIAGEKGLPADLLTGTTEETMKAQADAILAFAKPNGYPKLPDGGEVRPGTTSTTRDHFKEWVADQLQ